MVLNFSRSEEFYENILIGPLSSIPRWCYARKLESLNRAPETPRTTEALGALLGGKRGVIHGENYPVNHFIDRDCNSGRLRLFIYLVDARGALPIGKECAG